MTVTMKQALDALTALDDLAKIPGPPKIAYRISKLLRQLRPEQEHFEEARHAFVKSIGIEREATTGELMRGLIGPMWDVPPERLKEFGEKMNELLDASIDTNGAKPLTMPEIEQLAQVKAETLTALGPFFEEDAT